MGVTPEELERGQRLVEDLAGVLLEPHDLPAFVRAVAEGMSRAGKGRPEEYFEYLESPEGRKEQERLLEEVVNNETYFFREPQHFEVLSRLLPGTCGAGGESRRGRMRVLSAGCSTGEEPYSLAMELLELAWRLPGLDFEIAGVDISPRALDLARKGIFGPNSFRNPLARARREAWFEPAGDRRHQLSDRVAGKVEFHCLNLNAEHSLRGALGVMDVIFFRNVLIYLSPAARIQVCRNLVAALRDSGYLFIGTSEVLPPGIEGVVSQQVDGVFFWKKGMPEGRGSLEPEVSEASQPRARPFPAEVPHGLQRRGDALPDQPHSGSGRDEVEVWYAEALKKVREDRAEEALEVLRRIFEEVPDHLQACRLMAELFLDRAEFEAALRVTDRVIEMNETLAWPYVLRGRISYGEGDAAAAQSELKKAIYYQPGYWPAHFYLAEVYKGMDERSLAIRAYRNALRNLEKEDPDKESGIHCIGYSRTDISLTCQMNIRALIESTA